MHANSEVGTLQPMREIGKITREHGIPLHVDAVQTFGKVPIDVDAFGIDLLSFSGHKIYGPKGVAGLYIRKGTKMVSVQHGGEHERRRRAGTENVAGIVGFGKAVEIRGREMAGEAVRLTGLRDRLWDGIRARVPEVRLNGHPDPAASRHLQYVLPERGVGIHRARTGSEGHRRHRRAPPAPRAMSSHRTCWWPWGVPLDWAMGSVRCSLGRSTTAEDIDYVIESMVPLAAKLRALSPVKA